MHRPAAAFELYKDHAHPAAQPSSSFILAQRFLALPFGLIMRRRPLEPGPAQESPCRPRVAEDADGTAGSKLEPLIYHSGFNALARLRRRSFL
jgi:hypothetical protein